MDIADLFPFSTEVGYLSLTLVNFIGSLVPFVPLPGFLLLATMSVGDKFDLHVLALASALSATAAKQIIFLVSYEGRRIIKQSTRDRMRPFERLVRRYGAAAAFLAAATPIPDDLVYIPLGLAKYSPKRFLLATLAGKLLLSYAVVFVSHYLGLSLVEPYVESVEDPVSVYVGMVVFGAVMTTVVVMLLRLDWRIIMGRLAPWTLDENCDAGHGGAPDTGKGARRDTAAIDGEGKRKDGGGADSGAAAADDDDDDEDDDDKEEDDDDDKEEEEEYSANDTGSGAGSDGGRRDGDGGRR